MIMESHRSVYHGTPIDPRHAVGRKTPVVPHCAVDGGIPTTPRPTMDCGTRMKSPGAVRRLR